MNLAAMTVYTSFLTICILLVSVSSTQAGESVRIAAQGFRQNVGQVTDQHSQPRNDVGYVLTQPGFSIFITGHSFHYQWYKPTASDDSVKTYRLDVELVGSKPSPIVVEEDVERGQEIYYAHGLAGASARSFKKLTFKEVYPNIDWVLYATDNGLKYDFVIHPGGNPEAIKLCFGGASSMELSDGSLVVTTPMGSIHEQPPYAFEQESGRIVSCTFQLDSNIVSFETAGYAGTLVIDPVVAWSTFYGGNTYDYLSSIKADDSGNLYATGFTLSANNIATTGSYQATIGGAYDIMLIKFNSSGVRLWGSYFGNSGQEQANALSVNGGDIYVVGHATSGSLATPGSHQTTFGGGARDGLLLKFDANGSLIWSTYYGGNNIEVLTGVTSDSAAVYITGTTRSADGIASINGYQQTYSDSSDVLIARFDHSGVRQWGTYFGGTGRDSATAIVAAPSGRVYLAGLTNSNSGIATPGSHQPAHGGGSTDAFLARFDATGQPLWGTYYGGNGSSSNINEFELATTLSMDEHGNVYVSGRTLSTNNIATAGVAYSTYNGNTDGFTAKFDSTGARLWGSYFGGSGSEQPTGSAYKLGSGRIYLTGFTNSGNLASADALQPVFDTSQLNPADMFFAAFDDQGQQIYCTYYGLAGFQERANSVCYNYFDASFAFAGVVSGNAASLATPGAHQSTSGGQQDALIVCFRDTTGQFHKPQADSAYCQEQNFVVLNNIAGMFSANNTFRVELSDALGSFANPDTIGSVIGGVTGFIPCSIPAGTPPGTGYRVRVTASSPPAISQDNGSNIHIYPVSASPSVVVSVSPDSVVLSGTFVTFTATVMNGGINPQFQWRRNGISIVGANSNSYSTSSLQNGDVIDLHVQGSDFCANPPDVLSNKITMHIPNGASELPAIQGVSLYPNPISDKLYISNPAGKNLQIDLRETTGRRILSLHSEEVLIQLPTSYLSDGFYFYQVYVNGTLVTSGKLVKY